MDDNDEHETEDDALEDTRPDDFFDPVNDEEKLDGDYDPPAAPTVSNKHHIPPTHPITDDDIDTDELYSEGLGEAADIDDREEDSDDAPAQPFSPED
jgi:hypothetical protein